MSTPQKKPMIKFIKVIAAFLMGIIFAACQHQPEQDIPAEEEEEKPDFDTVIYDDEHTLEALQIDPFWQERIEESPEDVLHTVLITCVSLEDSYVSDIILDIMNKYGVSELSAQHMVEVSVFTVCPEYEDYYEAYLKSRLK